MNRLSNTDAAGRFQAYSAGSFHRGMVHPYTLQLLANNNYDPSEFRSKNWQEFAEPDAPVMPTKSCLRLSSGTPHQPI